MRDDGKYRILLADDDRGLCAVLQAYLDLQPDLCCCAVAYNGLHALEKTRQQKPDLVLLDIQMPGLNGADFMAELSSSPGLSEVRVLAFTAYDQALVTREMLRLGACGVLQKPYPLEMLMRRIRSLLQNRQPAQDMTPQRAVATALLGFGVPTDHVGYCYLQQILLLLVEEDAQGYTIEELYHRICKMHGLSGSGSVERAIREEVKRIFKAASPEFKELLHLARRDGVRHLSNGECLTLMAQAIRLKYML